ncbi:MAG: guanylate kinase [Acidobacteria bacterium]|nr:guanylate kinase [Acidobacteriota bacterium]
MDRGGAVFEHRGSVFVVSAPSGTGKSTLSQRLVQSVPGLIFSISFTTRAPRPGEVDGKDYFFVDNDKFDAMVERGEFVEWVEVYGRKYGTGRTWLESVLSTGQDVLLDIETTGALNLRQAIPDAHMIFILPPSARILEARLRGRGKDSEEQIRMRMEHARHELELFEAYDHLIVNEDLEKAYRGFEAIILATRSRKARMANEAKRILSGF